MITAQAVKELRERTGAGMMDCKKALTETNGDMEKAVEVLREKGLTNILGFLTSTSMGSPFLQSTRMILWQGI